MPKDRKLRPDRPTMPRPMDWLGGAVTWLIIWLTTPLLLAAFWWRSMPAHLAWLSLLIAAALFVSLYATTSGWLRARARLDRPGFQSRDESVFGKSPVLPATWRNGGAVLAAILVLVSLARTQFDIPVAIGEWQWSSLAPINLVDAEIVAKPADWVGRGTAERRFRITWCRDRQIPADACEPPTEPYHTAAREIWCSSARTVQDCAAEFRRLDSAFDQEWQEQRREYLANLTKPDLAGRDLRGANAAGAFLAGMDISGARLEGANLIGARLEGANLNAARLEGANLIGARLEGANLSAARLEGTNLSEAQLEGADLREARLEGVNLSEARLEGADLSGARLESANLRGARLEKTNLYEAWLEGARLEGAWLYRADFSRANLERANLWGAWLEEATFHEAWLERANLSEAMLEGAILSYAQLTGANLYRARLEGAYLSWADLSGADLSGADLSGAELRLADWAGAIVAASPVHSTDFTAGSNLTQIQLAQVIGDGETILPLDAETGEQLWVWTCWAEPPPTLGDLLRRHPPVRVAELRAEWLCPPDVAPERTGRAATPQPAAPSAD